MESIVPNSFMAGRADLSRFRVCFSIGPFDGARRATRFVTSILWKTLRRWVSTIGTNLETVPGTRWQERSGSIAHANGERRYSRQPCLRRWITGVTPQLATQVV